MNVDLSDFTPIKAVGNARGMWIRINFLSSISADALEALGSPSYIAILYSEKDDTLLITPSVRPGEGFKLSPSRQFRSRNICEIAKEHGWENRRYAAVMTEAGLLVRHHEEDTHHE